MRSTIFGPGILALAVPALLLGACSIKVGKDEGGNGASVAIGEDGNVHMSASDGAKAVSVSVPGFSAKVDVPGLQLSSSDTDIGGMKLYPGTKISGVNIDGRNSGGTVDMRVTSPASPGAVADYYANAARDHDFTEVATKRDGDRAIFTAKKPDGDLVTIALAPEGGGSSGEIKITDAKK